MLTIHEAPPPQDPIEMTTFCTSAITLLAVMAVFGFSAVLILMAVLAVLALIIVLPVIAVLAVMPVLAE